MNPLEAKTGYCQKCGHIMYVLLELFMCIQFMIIINALTSSTLIYYWLSNCTLLEFVVFNFMNLGLHKMYITN